MKAIATPNNTTSNTRVFVLLMLLLLSSVGMFGQEAKNQIAAPAVVVSTSVAAATNTTSQLELVSWFMGSKQSQLSTNNTINTTSTNNSGKKQFINCGMTPNRILSRTFLKKAINHDSTIA